MTRVVLIDDDPEILSLYERIMAQAGLQVVGTATDGNQGVLAASATNPDVIVLDLSMPNADGLEALLTLRKADSSARIVVVSGFQAQHVEPVVLELGAHDYVSKDSGPTAVAAAVKAAAQQESRAFAPPSPERVAYLVERARQLI